MHKMTVAMNNTSSLLRLVDTPDTLQNGGGWGLGGGGGGQGEGAQTNIPESLDLDSDRAFFFFLDLWRELSSSESLCNQCSQSAQLGYSKYVYCAKRLSIPKHETCK